MTAEPLKSRARLYSGQSPTERDAERRRRLLESGRELFGTIGYSSTSVERLCSEAKVSTRHFYQLYDNKEAAFLDVYDDINAQALGRALESMAQTEGETIGVRLPRALIAYLGPTVEDARATRIAFLEVMGVSPRVEESRLQQRETLIGLVEQEGAAAVARGEISDRDFRFATLALVGAVNAIIYDWTLAGGSTEVAALEDALTELALTLLVR